MIHRRILPEIQSALQRQAAVVLMGPRQVGKTTLALTLGRTLPSLYLDLENPADRQNGFKWSKTYGTALLPFPKPFHSTKSRRKNWIVDW